MTRLTVLGLLCCLACATASPAPTSDTGPRINASGNKPDWVSGESSEYPRARYLTGVGSANSRADAENRGRAAISEVFSSNVTARTTSVQEERNVTGPRAENTGMTSVSQRVQNISQTVLQGTEVAETWTEKSTGREWALVVLDRQKGLGIVRDQKKAGDEKLLSLNDQLGKATEQMARVQLAVKLLSGLNERTQLAAKERVLDPSGVAEPLTGGDENAIRASASKVLGETKVVVTLTGSEAKEIATAIVDGFATMGIGARVGGDAAAADLLVAGNVVAQPVDGDQTADVKWARATVTVTLTDVKASKAIGQFEVTEKDASRDYAQAQRHALVASAKKITPKISATISSYFDSN